MYPSCGKILSSTRIVFHSSAIRMPSAGCVPSVISNLAFQCWIFICNPLVLRTTFYSKEIFSVCLTKTSMRGGGFLWWTDPEQYSFFFGFQRIVLSSKGRHVRIYTTPSFCPSVRIIHHLLLFCFCRWFTFISFFRFFLSYFRIVTTSIAFSFPSHMEPVCSTWRGPRRGTVSTRPLIIDGKREKPLAIKRISIFDWIFFFTSNLVWKI